MDMLTELMSELHRKEITEEMESIHLEERATKGRALLDKNLALIGEWMVSHGEELRQRYQNASQEAVSSKLSSKAV